MNKKRTRIIYLPTIKLNKINHLNLTNIEQETTIQQHYPSRC